MCQVNKKKDIAQREINEFVDSIFQPKCSSFCTKRPVVWFHIENTDQLLRQGKERPKNSWKHKKKLWYARYFALQNKTSEDSKRFVAAAALLILDFFNISYIYKQISNCIFGAELCTDICLWPFYFPRGGRSSESEARGKLWASMNSCGQRQKTSHIPKAE